MTTITNSKEIGRGPDGPLFSWDEIDEAGTVRSFEEYMTTVYAPALDLTIGLSLVREVAA
jgi:hypothetical protein